MRSNAHDFFRRLYDFLDVIVRETCPLQTKRISVRPRVPWYNAEIVVAKRNHAKAERRWRATKLLRIVNITK